MADGSSMSVRNKRKKLLAGMRGSTWAYHEVPRLRLEELFVDMVHRLQLLGVVVSHVSLSWDGTSPKERLALAHLGFLFKGYRVGVWYWEVVELIRKLIFNALMSFIYPGSRTQLVLGFVVAVVFALASAKLVPTKDTRVAAMHFMASIALSTTLLYALVWRLLQLGEKGTGEQELLDALSWFAFLLNCTVIGFPLLMYIQGTAANPFVLWRRLVGEGHRLDPPENGRSLARAASDSSIQDMSMGNAEGRARATVSLCTVETELPRPVPLEAMNRTVTSPPPPLPAAFRRPRADHTGDLSH